LTRKNPSPIWPIMCLVGRYANKPYSINHCTCLQAYHMPSLRRNSVLEIIRHLTATPCDPSSICYTCCRHSATQCTIFR